MIKKHINFINSCDNNDNNIDLLWNNKKDDIYNDLPEINDKKIL